MFLLTDCLANDVTCTVFNATGLKDNPSVACNTELDSLVSNTWIYGHYIDVCW